jgi:phenylpropionate dioxygenase-like ring-hydroxylating dioxygenase large terminal subunit
MFPRNAWYIAAWGDEVGAAPLARRICNEPIVLFRDRDGRAAALADRCCHRSAPLSLGRVVEQGIECGYHGLVIDSAGKCVKVPGQRLIPDEVTVRSYPLVEKNQLVWVWLGAPRRSPIRRPSSIFPITTTRRAGRTSTPATRSTAITR